MNFSHMEDEIQKWLVDHRLMLGIVVASVIVGFGLLIFAAMRRRIIQVKLTAALAVTTLAMAVYFGARAMFPDMTPEYFFWLQRAFWAAIVFAGLRVVDRLVVVPLLSRGGKVPVSRFVHQVILIVIGCFAILGYGAKAFGWDIDKFLEGSAVVSIVLGLALQETLGNFFSGLVMQAASPFNIGDWIECAGVEGRVVDMTWRAVTIHTNDDNYVLIPNGTVAKEQIVNFHSPTIATARTIEIGLEYDLPPGDAISVLRSATVESNGVEARPEPFIYLYSFADSSIAYKVKFWISEPSQHRKIEHQVRTNIWYRLREKGYSIPFPTRTVEHIGLERKARNQGESAARQRLAAISGQWLFAPLSEAEKNELAMGAKDVFMSAGQVLFREGDAGDSCYVIRKGDVDVLVKSNGSEAKVATLKKGDFFGEMSALTGAPRTATIRAATNLSCVQISKDDLAKVFAADPAVMEKLSQVIARRNADRQSIASAASPLAQEEMVSTQQKSLLGRMMRFFRGESDQKG